MISIIIPALNEERFLPVLLESLLAQTDDDFEVLVVDGGSKDKTIQVAEKYKKKLSRLEVIRSPKASLPYQRNLGAKLAHGDWLVFVDADSVFLPYFITRCKQCIDERKPGAIAVWFRPDSEVAGDALLTLMANVAMELSLIFKRPLTPGPLTVVSRVAFEDVLGYDVSHEFSEDLDFGMRLHKAKYPVVVLRETLCIWSLRRLRKEGSLSVLQKYVATGLAAVIMKHPLRFMPGYVMGGHVYKEKGRRSVIEKLNKQVRALWRELIE